MQMRSEQIAVDEVVRRWLYSAEGEYYDPEAIGTTIALSDGCHVSTAS